MLQPLSTEEARRMDGVGGAATAVTAIDMNGLAPDVSSADGASFGRQGSHAQAHHARAGSSSAKFQRHQRHSSMKQDRSHVFRTCTALPEYFTRIWDYRQMDLDATFYQMVTLCVQPSKVYKSAYYRKQTKNRWARDDPAFAVIQLLFLLVATVAWAVAFRVTKLSSYLSLLFHAVVVEWLGFGLVIATACWWIANNFLRLRGNQGIGDTFFVEQRVEWQFAFDIHCNSFFIMFLFLYVLQFLLIPVLASSSFLGMLTANLLYALGWGFYIYITFLGYMALPFLHRTERFLYPLVVVGALFLSSLLLRLLFGATFNLSAMSTYYYYAS
ncbi:TPA: hypothetical protein N0F65_000958 [Lagenidium giganteum]|uniref:Uncharacterized protein n=1 Tax=Lagenidium giganteum TaxID=4803 RepID=A0AAV2Z092_9STRA|nr:TPA: hypothetical protein N0F65_000958 [Lagenidium giganteum]